MNLENYEKYALDYLEGQLTSEQKMVFELFLQDHPQIKAELEELAEIRLVANPAVKYPDKSKLYRNGNIRPFPLFRWGVAASVLLLIGFGLFYRKWEQVEFSSDRAEWTAATEEKPISEDDGKEKLHEKGNELFSDREGIVQPEKMVSPGDSHHPEHHAEAIPKLEITPKSESLQETIPSVIQSRESFEEIVREINPEIINQQPVWAEVSMKEIQPLEKISLSEYRLEYTTALQRQIAEPRKKSSPRIYSIHLPDEFFSEAWSDLSLNDFKDRIIPEFFKTKSK